MKRTDGIGPQFAQHAALGDGLKGGAAQDDVDPFLQEVTEAQLLSDLVRHLPELPVVGV